MDAADRANDIIEQRLKRSINAVKQRQQQTAAIECEDCGEPIPEKRRKMVIGCNRCFDCQQIYEKKKKHFRF